jgi:hypothetical protein
MIEAKEIYDIYMSKGINILATSFLDFDNPEKFVKDTKKRFGPSLKAAKQILSVEDPTLGKYWEKIAPALMGVFFKQLKKPDAPYKNWNIHLPTLPGYPETGQLANLATATNRKRALLALEKNNYLIASRFEQGSLVVLAADGEVLGGETVEVDVSVARVDTSWQKKFVANQIKSWLNKRYHTTHDPLHMTMTWLASAGWPSSSQNLGHEKTVIFTNLLKNLPQAEVYCKKFGWRFPGEDKIKEAMIALFVAHEDAHGIRARKTLLNELSADLPTWMCLIDLSQKRLLGTIGVRDVILAIFAEYAIQAKAPVSKNEMIEAYRLSGLVAMNTMLETGLIVPRRDNLKLDMNKLADFYREVAQQEKILSQGGVPPINELPGQLLDML